MVVVAKRGEREVAEVIVVELGGAAAAATAAVTAAAAVAVTAVAVTAFVPVLSLVEYTNEHMFVLFVPFSLVTDNSTEVDGGPSGTKHLTTPGATMSHGARLWEPK